MLPVAIRAAAFRPSSLPRCRHTAGRPSCMALQRFQGLSKPTCHVADGREEGYYQQIIFGQRLGADAPWARGRRGRPVAARLPRRQSRLLDDHDLNLCDWEAAGLTGLRGRRRRRRRRQLAGRRGSSLGFFAAAAAAGTAAVAAAARTRSGLALRRGSCLAAAATAADAAAVAAAVGARRGPAPAWQGGEAPSAVEHIEKSGGCGREPAACRGPAGAHTRARAGAAELLLLRSAAAGLRRGRRPRRAAPGPALWGRGLAEGLLPPAFSPGDERRASAAVVCWEGVVGFSRPLERP